jgi:hypothetical protein
VTLYLDYGQVQQAKVRDNGSIIAYARVAMANQDYKYLNADGSIRIERISRDQLFDSASVNTIKMQPLTLGHPIEGTDPEFYQKNAIGSVGNLVINGLDGDCLGVIVSIQRKDAIDAYNAGKVRQFSPAYTREATLKDGIAWQSDRDYKELGFVSMARGGQMMTLKDGWVFDPGQIDDDMIQLWGNPTGLQTDAIERLFDYGTLTPHPIVLPTTTMTLVSMTIGGKTLQVDSASADVAAAIAAEHAALKASNENALKLTDGLAKAEVDLSVAKDQAAKLETDNKALSDSVEARIKTTIKALCDSRDHLAAFVANGFAGEKAKLALDAMDLITYKKEIVSQKSATAYDAAGIDTVYNYLVDAYGKPTDKMMLPSTTMVAAASGASNGSVGEAQFNQIDTNFNNATRNGGLPPEKGWS